MPDYACARGTGDNRHASDAEVLWARPLRVTEAA